jgi:hypothetical protein
MKPIILVIVMSAGLMYLLLHSSHQKINTQQHAKPAMRQRVSINSLNNYATGRQELLMSYLLW